MTIKFTGDPNGGSIKFTGSGAAGLQIFTGGGGGGGRVLSLPAGFVDGVGYTGSPSSPNLAPFAISWNGVDYAGSSFTFDSSLTNVFAGGGSPVNPIFSIDLVALGPWNGASVPLVVELGTSPSVALNDPYVIGVEGVKPTLDGSYKLTTNITNPGDISFVAPATPNDPAVSHAGVGACQLSVTGEGGASLSGVPLIVVNLKMGMDGSAPRSVFAIRLASLPF